MRALIPSMLLALSACESAPRCNEVAIFGLRAFLRDSVTGTAHTDTAIAVARDPVFVDTLLRVADSVLAGVAERAGTYRLDVYADGYRTWTRTGIVVTQKDQCHVQPTDVTVRLAPL